MFIQNGLKKFHPHSGIVFGLRKEENSSTCYNMAVPWGHYAQWNKPVMKRQTLHYFTWGTQSS